MTQKKTDRKIKIGLKNIQSIVPINIKLNKLSVNPLNVIVGTKN